MFGGETKFFGKGKTDFSTFSDEVWTWDESNRWNMPFPLSKATKPNILKRSAPACGSHPEEKKLYAFGGRNGEDHVTNHLWEINLSSQIGRKVAHHEFTHGSTFPLKSKGSCAVSPPAYYGKTKYNKLTGFATLMLIHGGRVGNHYRDTLYELSIDKKKRLRWSLLELPQGGVKPHKRNHHGCTYSPGVLWIFGGRSNHRHSKMGLLNDLWKYDIATGIWTEIPPAENWPAARFLPSFQYNPTTGEHLIFGGQTTKKKLNDLWTVKAVKGGYEMIEENPVIKDKRNKHDKKKKRNKKKHLRKTRLHVISD